MRLDLPLQKNLSSGYCWPQVKRTFGENLREQQAKAGMRTKELARRLGVVNSAVSGWRHDKAKAPDLSTFLKLAKVLGCSVDDLLKGYDPDYDHVIAERDLIRQLTDQKSGLPPTSGGPNDPAAARVFELESELEALKAAFEEVHHVAGQLFEITINREKSASPSRARSNRRKGVRKAG